jgi:hypothetical protein
LYGEHLYGTDIIINLIIRLNNFNSTKVSRSARVILSLRIFEIAGIHIHPEVEVLHLIQPVSGALKVHREIRLNLFDLTTDVLAGPLSLSILADVTDISARQIQSHVSKVLELFLAQLLSIPLENKGSCLAVWQFKSDA